ncbi:nicotinamide riboside transporter PnuC [Membranihabitans maritimus]|uniref:nicotinamide riboside transporter PnuC n=1 Tax=Membranihabitans maritimus TaxID=2904244 RepID=UPI001F009800|nr:nicotinamide riboside transporter PnuC [Membranihabitans maritimus]
MLEYIGVITGFICVWLAARNSLWNFPIAIISVIIYIFIFYEAKLYADMGLQFYFLGMSIYGWYYWINRRGDDQLVRPVRRINKLEVAIGLLAIIIFTSGFGFFLQQSTDAHFPYLDSFCTSCSLVAQFYLSRRILENWLLWVFVDIVYVYLYISKGLYPTTILYAVYIGVAIFGYLEWRKNWKKNYKKSLS